VARVNVLEFIEARLPAAKPTNRPEKKVLHAPVTPAPALTVAALLLTRRRRARPQGGPGQNEVQTRCAEVAPGVFFRYSSISAPPTRTSPFGGCNKHLDRLRGLRRRPFDAKLPPRRRATSIAAIKKDHHENPFRYGHRFAPPTADHA